MKRSVLERILREVLTEDGAIGNVTGAMDGGMGSPKTPKAFSKKKQVKNSATLESEEQGYTTVKRPKHPSHTKMWDFVKEAHYNTPHAFVSEEEMMNSEAVKHTEEMGYELANKTKKASDKKKK